MHDDTGSARTKASSSNSAAREEDDAALRRLYDKELKPSTRLLDRASVKYQVEIRTGPSAAREILACAKAGKFDQIVLGAKGRSAIADLLLGSVAHRVLATAEVPVLLVK